MHVARESGLPPPVPITAVHPGSLDTDESSWQRLVLEHIGVRDRMEVRMTDREGLLCPMAVDSLRGNGLIWPAALHLLMPILAAARGGTLITGEGGDEVLGARRVTPLSLLVRYRRRPDRSLLADTGRALTPSWWQRRADARSIAQHHQSPWLTPSGVVQAANAVAASRSFPLSYRRETLKLRRRRGPVVLQHNYRVMASQAGVQAMHPFLEDRFLAELARDGGFWGYAGRTDVMRRLFSDVLPEELLSRSTKAHFTATRFGQRELEFARTWSGTGLDGGLIDPDRLREHWLSGRPRGTSGLLMQAAWLADQANRGRCQDR
jgi:asparagine synthase (glutamine-hydrolysing)